MKIGKYRILNLLGRGSYGCVNKVRCTTTNTYYALKKIKLLRNSTIENKNIINEIKILKYGNCPYILKLHDILIHGINICLVTDYVNNGDLSQFIYRNKCIRCNIDEKIIWNYFIQIALGVRYLHNNNIIHRDLKTKNIFIHKVRNYSIIKIGDFGIAKIIQPEHNSNTIIGTPNFMSPEIYKCEVYNKKTDIWSLGCILFEMIELKLPFIANTIQNLSRKIKRGKYKSFGKLYSMDITSLIPCMLEINVKKRNSIYDILEKESIKLRMGMVPFNEDSFGDMDNTIYKRVSIPKFLSDWKYIVRHKFDLKNIGCYKSNSKIKPISKLSKATKPISKLSKATKPISKLSKAIKPIPKLSKAKFIVPYKQKKPQMRYKEEGYYKKYISIKMSQYNLKPTKLKNNFIIKIGSRHEHRYNLFRR